MMKKKWKQCELCDNVGNPTLEMGDGPSRFCWTCRDCMDKEIKKREAEEERKKQEELKLLGENAQKEEAACTSKAITTPTISESESSIQVKVGAIENMAEK